MRRQSDRLGGTRPRAARGARAWAIAWVRLATPSLPSRLLTCFLTVASEMTSVRAMS